MKTSSLVFGVLLLLGIVDISGPRNDLHASPPPLTVQARDKQSVRLAWTNAPGNVLLEEVDTLAPSGVWRPFSQTPTLLDGEYSVVVSFTELSRFFRLHEMSAGGVPSDLANVASPPARGVATLIGAATRFLYTGSNAIQFGVAPGTIESKRAAVLRGKMLTRSGTPLAGVQVTILDHPEFGSTLSRESGLFDLAVNGGGPLTLDYEKAGFCPVHRRVEVPWQDHVVMPDVVLAPLDPVVTPINLGSDAPLQVHQSSIQTDAEGSRRALLVFLPGTSASMVLANGATQNVTSLHVRATEFTVGATGAAAMPAFLPPLSGYTYCVEFSADEALSAGATSVLFSQPVSSYVENFLNFPAGTIVPVGFYDRQKAAWVPMPNGRIVTIVGVTGGLADVDTDGDKAADNGLGITVQERQVLAASYAPGQTLWRVPLTHFSADDKNWPFSKPDDATSPADNGAGPDADEPLQDPCLSDGSIIECENQVLGESVPIVGTLFSLNYRSDRMPGQPATRTITLSGASVPASLASISLHLSVAGQNFNQEFPAGPNQRMTFVWNRLDAYDRPVIGGQTLDCLIDYNYPTTYQAPGPFPAAFNQPGGVSLAANPARQQISLSQHFTTTIGEGLTDARTIGLGGWTLDVHQIFDPTARVLHAGGGGRRRAASLARIITTTDLPGRSILFDVAVGPDGSQYVALPHGDLIVRVAPDGTQAVVAGNGTEGFSGDGGPATQAMLGDPVGIVVAPDGALLIAEESNFRIRRVSRDGIISTIAGTGVGSFGGDDGPATEASLSRPERLALGIDSSLYVIDGGVRIRRITPDGIIRTVAGNGAVGFSGDNGPATDASLNCFAVAAIPDGGFYLADFGNHRVRRVGPDGIIKTVADSSFQAGLPVSISRTADGSLFVAITFNGARTPQIDRLNPDGSIITVAGGGSSAIQEGIPATQANLGEVRSVAAAPDGSIFIAPGNNDSRLFRVGPALPGFEGNGFLIASEDGGQLYVFDPNGRHLRTLNALTGASLFEFGYDASGRLNQITEKTGGSDNLTTIEHDTAGNPTAIIGPFGARTILSVDANGFLAIISNPAGESVRMTSDAGGLLTTYADPRGKTNSFHFDQGGRLLVDADPAGGAQTLARTPATSGFAVARTTTLGRVTTHAVANLPGNTQQRTVTQPDGTQSQSTETIDAGKTKASYPDGTTLEVQSGPDPRFGMEAPLTAGVALTFPSTLQLTATNARSVVLAKTNDPSSLVRLAETTTVDGRTTTEAYTAATKTTLLTTPAGRTLELITDDLGRPVSGRFGGLAPTVVTYNDRGRVATVARGEGASARTITLGYDSQGFLESLLDPLGRTARFTNDPAGRMVSKIFPDGGVASFGYDAAGNLTNVQSAGQAAHSFTYSDRNQLTAVTPPSVPGSGPTLYSYNLDKQLTAIVRPDGRTLALAYDAGGRLVSRAFSAGGIANGADTLSYDGAGRVSTISARSGVDTRYSYDGSLLVGRAWSGVITGTVTRSYDSGLRVSSQSINGGDAIKFLYDADDLLVGAGSLTIRCDAQSGLQTGTTLGNLETSAAYNGFGELTNYAATLGGGLVFRQSLAYDNLGRVNQRTETVAGTTDTYQYAYDAAGQLTEVTKNSVVVESYAYDANGNRTNSTVANVNSASTYDAQDRLLTSGTATRTYTPNGELSTLTAAGQTTAYQYDELGNLLAVTLPDGTALTYLVDGNNRRVGKKLNGALAKAFLYADRLRPAAELDGTGAVVSQFVFAGGNTPAYMIRDGVNFRILSDGLGSVRLVVNSASGAIAQRLDYDSFGNVTQDTNPGFQPFGFAGGLYDPATGLVRFGARDYDPSTGRWTAKDPAWFAGNDLNLYRYARNDPVNLFDLTGMGPTKWEPFGHLNPFAEKVITKIEQVFSPENGEELESKVEFIKRRNQTLAERTTGRAAGKDLAKCMGEAGEAASRLTKGLKAVGEFINLYDVFKLEIDSLETGKDVSLQDLTEAYLGYPVRFESSPLIL